MVTCLVHWEGRDLETMMASDIKNCLLVLISRSIQEVIYNNSMILQTVTVSLRTMSVSGSRVGRNNTTTTSLAYPVMTMSSSAAWQSSTPAASAGCSDTTTRYMCMYMHVYMEFDGP